MAYENTKTTLNERYSKCWRSAYQKMVKNKSGKKLPDQSFIDNAFTEAHWMSVTFNSAAFMLMSVFLSFFLLSMFEYG
ncbi:MAG: hypothetical protein MHPSP_001656, partial [Paramarteilia canceri]